MKETCRSDLGEDEGSWKRVFVVVDRPAHSLEWVLDKTGRDLSHYDGPKLVEEYESAEIYLYERQ